MELHSAGHNLEKPISSLPANALGRASPFSFVFEEGKTMKHIASLLLVLSVIPLFPFPYPRP